MEELLQIEHLSKTYGKRRVVDDLSLSVRAGEVFGFLGPNGAGKTTTIKMVMGFLFPDAGTIRIAGYDQKKQYEKALACIGGIVENPEMFKNFSGVQNIEMYARLHGNIPKSRINEVIELVGMSERKGDKIKKYSLGMKQRIGLAQALVHEPRVLILDEPTNGLDPAGIKELREILKKLAHEQGVAVMVSSHQLSEMQLMCDRVAIIDRGKLLGVRTVDELTHSAGQGLYRIIADPERSRAALTDYEQSISGDGDKSLTLRIGEEEIPAVVRALVNANVDVFGVERVEHSLEDAFINITGGQSNA